jgi:hypothetical protein
MRDIDRITATLATTFEGSTQLPALKPLLAELAECAKRKCEILRTDPASSRSGPPSSSPATSCATSSRGCPRRRR